VEKAFLIFAAIQRRIMDKSVVLAALNTKCLQIAQIPEFSWRSLSGIKQDFAVGKNCK